MKKRIVLYGVGFQGEVFYCSYGNSYDIEYCIDRNSGRFFHGLRVYSLDEKEAELSDKLIIVAANLENYRQIALKLTECGLIERRHFLWAELLNKKLAILYGNCHLSAVKDYLEHNPYFARDYCILYQFVKDVLMPDAFWSNCDLLICQDIREGNSEGAISADEAERKVSESCIKIRIPNLFGFASFFPQSVLKQQADIPKIDHLSQEAVDVSHAKNAAQIQNLVTHFAWQDSHIDTMYISGAKVDDIAKSIRDEEIWGAYRNVLNIIWKKYESEKSNVPYKYQISCSKHIEGSSCFMIQVILQTW